MRPARAQVVRVDAVGERSVGIVFGAGAVSEDIADATKDVAAIIKGRDLKCFRQRRARFEVDDGQGVPADGNCERVELNQIAFAVAKDAAAARDWRLQKTFGHDDARPRFLESDAAQCGRTAGEESLADRQRSVNVVYHSVAVTISRIKERGEAERDVGREHSSAHLFQLIVATIIGLELMEGEIAAELTESQTVIERQKIAALRFKLIVARVADKRRAEP